LSYDGYRKKEAKLISGFVPELQMKKERGKKGRKKER
jgi:hypothetical protein